ncbi:linear amide C-N hydrolase [candidate division KSB1 bacterium]|nr:linear amide C-N hydrolase [candidate division KSB1 bacterium]
MKTHHNVLIIWITLILSISIPTQSIKADLNTLPDFELPIPSLPSPGIRDTVLTLRSVEKSNNLYTLTYHGGYRNVLERMNQDVLDHGTTLQYSCTMFSALGNPDGPLMARNFDSPASAVLLGHYNPPDGYSSVAFSRMNDLGFNDRPDFKELPLSKRIQLLNAPFYAIDGMNSQGVAIAIAQVRPQNVKINPNKKTIFITMLVREILDHAANIDDAIELVYQYNIIDRTSNIISNHLLITDASGRSVIIEYNAGQWNIEPNRKPWQVISNIPTVDVSLNERMSMCWRFKTAQVQLAHFHGNFRWNQALETLMSISMKNTQWSSIYDLKNRIVFVSLHAQPEVLTFKVE